MLRWKHECVWGRLSEVSAAETPDPRTTVSPGFDTDFSTLYLKIFFLLLLFRIIYRSTFYI